MPRDLVRVNINFARELLQQIDEWADSVGVTRSAAVAVLCSQTLTSYKMVGGLDYAVKADRQQKGVLDIEK